MLMMALTNVLTAVLTQATQRILHIQSADFALEIASNAIPHKFANNALLNLCYTMEVANANALPALTTI